MIINEGVCYLSPGSNIVEFSNDVLDGVETGYSFRVRGDEVLYTISAIDAANKKIRLSSNYANDRFEETVYNEVADVGDGGASYAFALDYFPVEESSLTITDGVETFTDDGSGTLTGDLGGSGTINYLNGNVSMTFNSNVGVGVNILATYTHGIQMNGYSYSIITDYTENLNLPEPSLRDSSAIATIREALRIIDSVFTNIFKADPVEHTAGTTLAYADLGRTHRLNTTDDQEFILPASSELTANDDGVMVKFIKMQAGGTVTITAGTDTYIMGGTELELADQYSSAFLEYSFSDKIWYNY